MPVTFSRVTALSGNLDGIQPQFITCAPEVLCKEALTLCILKMKQGLQQLLSQFRVLVGDEAVQVRDDHGVAESAQDDEQISDKIPATVTQAKQCRIPGGIPHLDQQVHMETSQGDAFFLCQPIVQRLHERFTDPQNETSDLLKLRLPPDHRPKHNLFGKFGAPEHIQNYSATLCMINVSIIGFLQVVTDKRNKEK